MDWKWMILGFIFLMFVVCGGLIMWIKIMLESSATGAVKRLNDEIASINAKQDELAQKLKQADEDLAQRRQEAKELADKMQSEAEESSKEAKEKIVNDARKEAEDIIVKAKNSTEKMREELEKQVDVKSLGFGMKALNSILSDKAKGVLDTVLINEFLEKLKDIDMTRISPDIQEAELVSLGSIDESIKTKFSELIRSKLNRELKVNMTTDAELGGGIILKFGTMALDGSMRNLIRESAAILQEKVEEK